VLRLPGGMKQIDEAPLVFPPTTGISLGVTMSDNTYSSIYPADTVVLLGQESDGGGSHAARGSPAGTLSWAARAALTKTRTLQK